MIGGLKLLRAALPYLLVIAAVIGVYAYGVSTTTTKWKATNDKTKADHQAQLANINAMNALGLAILQARLREQEQHAAEQMAALDQRHQDEMQNEINSRDRAIADVRAGSLRLRDKFACNAGRPADTGGTGEAGTSTGQRDAAAQGGLQHQDAEFLIRLASEADQVTLQLQACQGIVRNDRATSADGKGPSMPNSATTTTQPAHMARGAEDFSTK